MNYLTRAMGIGPNYDKDIPPRWTGHPTPATRTRTGKRPHGASLKLDGGWVRKPTRQVELSAHDIEVGKREAKRQREIADEAQYAELVRHAAKRMELVTAGLRTTDQVRREVFAMTSARRSFVRRYGREPEVR